MRTVWEDIEAVKSCISNTKHSVIGLICIIANLHGKICNLFNFFDVAEYVASFKKFSSFWKLPLCTKWKSRLHYSLMSDSLWAKGRTAVGNNFLHYWLSRISIFGLKFSDFALMQQKVTLQPALLTAITFSILIIIGTALFVVFVAFIKTHVLHSWCLYCCLFQMKQFNHNSLVDFLACCFGKHSLKAQKYITAVRKWDDNMLHHAEAKQREMGSVM